MTLLEEVIKSKPEDFEFITLAKEARLFLQGHNWCKAIEKQWLAANWDNILIVFYFDFIPDSSDTDDHVWVIVGDLPPAYIDVESANTETEAVQVYIEIMDDWVQCVKGGRPVEDCYPISIPPEIRYADMLDLRLQLIRKYILGLP
ncbi:MAG: hypothetical protein JNJ90_12410 [Saprospiraceae bacterium]|nr:hypothetical protein [Saprospiraceae bacterium]